MRKMLGLVAVGLALTGCGTTTAAKISDSTTSPTPTVTASPAPMSATAPSGEVVLTLARPTDGATAMGSLVVSGTAAAFEANVPWKLTDAASKVVKHGSFTANECCKLSPFHGAISLHGVAAGTYVLTVSLDDPSGGEGKPVPALTRTITIR